MFAKLLKYDIRATWGLMGLLSSVCLGAGVLGAVVLRMLSGSQPAWVETVCVIALLAVFFYVFGYWAAAFYLMLNRFYRSRFTDEGYLTFTLPVSEHQILLSGALVSGLGMLLALVVTVVSLGVMAFFGIAELDGQRMEFIRLCFEKLPEFVTWLGLGNIAMFVLCMAAFLVSELIAMMLSITAGALLGKKHKILLGCAVYYGIHVLLSVVMVILANTAGGAWGLYSEMSQNAFQQFTLTTMAQSLILSAAGYFAMYGLVKRKLVLN